MRIIFNLMNCGLGNNGGSSTIVRSANALHDLGHEVTIVDNGGNRHTWTPLRANFKKVRGVDYIPPADVIIATGYNTVKTTVEAPKRCGKKLHYIRGWETWRMAEDKIERDVLSAPTIKFVNSICLQKKLRELGHASYIIRPGYNFDEIYPTHTRTDDTIILGGLYNHGTKRSGKRVSWVLDTARFIKKNNDNVKLFMFGDEGEPTEKVVDRFIRRPSITAKNELLNLIDIWLAPSELEGLHIAPAEAMLTEAIAVRTNAPMCGMQDYIQHRETGIVTENNQPAFTEAVRNLLFQPMYRKVFGKAGRQKVVEIGSREMNMQRFIDLLKEYVV